LTLAGSVSFQLPIRFQFPTSYPVQKQIIYPVLTLAGSVSFQLPIRSKSKFLSPHLTYTGGYDGAANNRQNHNTAWIYKGTIKEKQ
jgi:hypothetical protein